MFGLGKHKAADWREALANHREAAESTSRARVALEWADDAAARALAKLKAAGVDFISGLATDADLSSAKITYSGAKDEAEKARAAFNAANAVSSQMPTTLNEGMWAEYRELLGELFAAVRVAEDRANELTAFLKETEGTGFRPPITPPPFLRRVDDWAGLILRDVPGALPDEERQAAEARQQAALSVQEQERKRLDEENRRVDERRRRYQDARASMTIPTVDLRGARK